ncbi:hypothetical protein [Borrelia parkeri]|uniref:hypothetical protein n=1 Tax=Borrelia parkeri TaxID=141 RepID=UPI0003DEDE0A|nr:hypothetical protein [Borrelia parkeri]AHF45622.1 hypothetical protein X966_p0365 [Borrelia parkeri HR1]UPA11272.1 hypothetical protein bpSLO_001123 [Borrelia parkeri]
MKGRMFTQFISIMCRVFSFYVLSIFLLSADVKTYYDNEDYCYKEYTEKFKVGSTSHIFLKKSYTTGISREKERLRLKNILDKDYKKAQEAYFSSSSLDFSIVGEHQAFNIKQVIFDGVAFTPSILKIVNSGKQLAEIKEFKIGPSSVNKQFLGVIFPFPVNNTFTINLRKRLIDKLKEKPRVKITLISIYGDEFVMETGNFIKKYDF